MSRFLLTACFLFVWVTASSQHSLPVGSHPPAVKFDHFPNPLYTFVWRNWNLVPLPRLAAVLHCDEAKVRELASDMGMEAEKPVPDSYQQSLYISLIRRNWHLLPYGQLLQLLEMTEEEMHFVLKEDDFLFHKLGQLKPQCEALHYSPPTPSEKQRAAEIKLLVKKHFGKPTEQTPRFSFIDDLKSFSPQPGTVYDNQEGLRFIYSYFGVFGDPLLNPRQDPYPDGLLSKLAERGINGIWMHVVLNQLVPPNGRYPEFGTGSEARLNTLRNIVARARKFGISVYLYMNEPRVMPADFFRERPHIAGAEGNGFIAMCTSTEEVRDWLESSLFEVFTRVPDLGGIFTISGSENHTHCASHGPARQQKCPRCKSRESSDIIAELNTAMVRGVHRAAPKAKTIIWDWGWNGHGDGTGIIRKLPKDAWFMSVSEWALPISRGGVESKVGEYSISSVGPGPRARQHWKTARERGLKTVAKVQFNNTWELSAVPWLPVLDLVAAHASNLAGEAIDGYMMSWSLGGYPSPNLEIANKFSRNPAISREQALREVAGERYGATGIPYAREAWTAFSEAFKEFPYHVGVVYNGPQQYGPANLLFARPTGYKSTMVGFPYDDLNGWRGIYPKEVFQQQFSKIAEGWKDGLKAYEKLQTHASADKRPLAASDYRIAKAAYLHFASVANQAAFVEKRDKLLQTTDPNQRKAQKKGINRILDSEIDLAKALYDIVCQDSRIGFEATNQYYYLPQDLIEKVINCTYLRSSETL